jgi:hypothetical protein
MRATLFANVSVLIFTFSLSCFAAKEGLEIRPLLPRKASGSTLFSLLADNATGVGYVKNALSQKLLLRLHESPSFSDKPAILGVCSGDFDGDDLPDLFFAYPYGGHRLFRNLGGFRFEDVTENVGLRETVADHWGVGCCFVDHDGDGDLDIFVAGSGDVNLLLDNRDDGSFRNIAKKLGIAHEGANVQMAFADYDLDGDLDGYLVTNRETHLPPAPKGLRVEVAFNKGIPVIEEKYRELYDVVFHPTDRSYVTEAGEYDHLFRNDGSRFKDVSDEVGMLGTDQGLSASWFDYDDDGFPDLYVANDFFGPDRLYHNKRNGSFEEVARHVLPHTPWFSMGTDVADVNNDGLFDLMGSDMAGSSHYKSKIGMGDMEKSSWFLTTSHPPQYMRNALYLNAGRGRFLEVAQLAGLANTDWTWSLKFADLDNDGRIDLFGTNGMTHDQTNSDLVAQAESFEIPAEKAAFWQKTPPKRDRNFAFRNLGDLRFASVGAKWGLDFNGVSYGAAIADFDGDGDLDLAVASLEDPVRLYRNESNTGHLIKIRLKGRKRNSHGIGAKVTIQTEVGIQARYLNSCQGYASANDPIIHFGVGDATVIKRLTVRWPLGLKQTFENLPVDKFFVISEPSEAESSPSSPEPLPLLVASNALSAFQHKENDFDDFKLQPLLPHRLSRFGPGMAWGDVDFDGDEDIFLGGASGQPSVLVLNDGNGTFTQKKLPYFENEQLLPFEDMGAVFLDADSDGDLDLYVVSGGFDPRPKPLYLRDRLYLNDGKGQLTLDLDGTPNIRDSGGPVAAADFDRDGDLDLFVGGRVVRGRYPTTPNSRLLRNDNGKFVDATDLLAVGLGTTGMVTGALWSDFDGDGWLDLLVTREWGPVGVWKNSGGKLTNVSVAAGTAELLGWWTGIAAADIDEDGDMDYALGNLGLNSKYHASKEKPYLAYFGDLDGSGVHRFVEACHEGNSLFPVRGKSCSTHAMPSLAKKFSTFHAFASAGLHKIYAPSRLKSALRLEINELASGCLINDGKGRLTFRALPRIAQASTVFGIAFGDIDSDGHQDLALAQNFFSPQPETGRIDGGLGLVLRGKGDGTFLPLRLDQSGFLLPGDAKALALTDLNGDARPEIVATVNSSSPKVFLNKVASGKPLAVRLTGFKGNLRGIGSRVTLHLKSGKSLVGEIASGSSHLTGGSPALFLAIPEGESAIGVTVRSPLGKVSRHEVPSGVSELALQLD